MQRNIPGRLTARWIWGLSGILAMLLMIPWAISVSAVADEIGASKAELIQGVLPTVVNVSVKKDEVADANSPVAAGAKMPQSNTSPTVKSYVGSGFVIDPSGLIVTNYHVVENAFEITIMLSDGSRVPARTLSASRLADIALVKVQVDHPLLAVRWGDSDKVQVGDTVFAAGNPFGLGLSVSGGIVSALNRDIQNSPYDDYIQTDATINHGNSGGPLFDMQGNMVGVNSAIISPTAGSAGVGFALPSNTARFVVERLQKYGWVRPSWIGIKIQQVTPDIAAARGMEEPGGSIVAWVVPDGPSAKAGISIGDVILGFDGRKPTDERALLRDIASSPVGDTIKLMVRHQGQVNTMPITTVEWPRTQWDALDAPVAVERPKMIIPPDLGLALGPITAEDRKTLGMEAIAGGVMVNGVAPNSDPANRGVVPGDVILRVQDKVVATSAQVREGIDEARTKKRDFVLMLVYPKVHNVPGPKWVALRVADET